MNTPKATTKTSTNGTGIRTKAGTYSRSLQIVAQFFPEVTEVRDAKKGLVLEVTKADCASKQVKSHKACAAAVACQRQEHADGVVISRAIAYIVKDKIATRYCVPNSLTREVVAFDRGAKFEPGIYALSTPPDDIAIGREKPSTAPTKNPKKRGEQVRHVTTNIRTVLGGRAQ
jgi:hypothetical protein